jgi:amino acid adenylation domain-containing protein/FkbH-like protein/non-ribosomal peptide synthase protein (TIGR01720 family)
MSDDRIQDKLRQLSPEQRHKLRLLLEAKKATQTTQFPSASGPLWPTSHGQRRIWTLEQFNAETISPYNISYAARLEGPLDFEAFRRAWIEVTQRHFVLRLNYTEGGAQMKEVVDLDENRAFECANLSGFDDPHAAFLDRAAALAREPFIEGDSFLWRIAVYTLGFEHFGLIWVVHHSICDGASIPVLVEDLNHYYSKETGISCGDLRKLSRHYPDYAVWQREQLETRIAASSLTFWNNLLSDLPEPLVLPTDRVRPATQSFTGAHWHVRLPNSIVEELERLASEEGVSLFMAYLSTFQFFLSRLSGQEDLIVGFPVSGRSHPELDGMVGFFVNSLPLRARMQPRDSFRGLLRATRDRVLEALKHQDVPFDVLIERLKIARDPSRSPLFDVMMGMEDARETQFRLGQLRVFPEQLDAPVSKVDLTFHFQRGATDLNLDIEYCTALFGRERIEHWGQMYVCLLENLVRRPDVPLFDIDWFSRQEKEQVVEKFARSKSGKLPETGIVAIFKQICERCSADPAVFYDGQEFSYAWLDERSDRLSALLQTRYGLSQGDIVGVMLERSPEMLVALLGILKSGAGYLPLNLDTPSERAGRILEDANVRVVLYDTLLPEAVRDLPVQGLDVRHESFDLPEGWQPVESAGRELAYVMYTSGSTGVPKGVMIEQRSVIRLVKESDFHLVRPGERVLQGGSLAFDASTFEIWGPLLNGGVCCLPKGKSFLDLDEFAEFLLRSSVDTAFLTTGFFNQLVDFSLNIFDGLKTVLTGGEKVSLRHVNLLRRTLPELNLLHVYGPTENTTFSTWYPVESEHNDDVPIGRPIAHSELFILDSHLRPVPRGITGEIYCGGIGLGRGYLNRAELTADLFVPHPFSKTPGERLYRSGDLGYWDHDGNVVFVGRNDDQVKIRGFRIEIGEIETRLRAHPSVEKAVVLARELGGTHELNAYLVAGEPLTSEDLRAWLLEVLPEYMVPARFVMLEQLPLNANGKVDRKALPDPESVQQAQTGKLFAEPEGEHECTLVDHLKSLLGLAAVSRYDNYFALGGDSIKAIQLGARLSESGWRLKLTDIFAQPVVKDLALSLRRDEQSGAVLEKVPLEGACEMTAIQRWFVEEHEAPFSPFNQVTFLRSSELLDAQKLENALKQLLARHDALRLKLVADASGHWRQEFLAPDAVALECPVIDLRSLSAEQALLVLREEVAKLELAIIAESGQLQSCAIFRFPDGDRFFWAIHHLAVDGFSWRILLEELELFYRHGQDSLPSFSADLPDWIQGCKDWLDSPAGAVDQAFWKERLSAFPGAEIVHGEAQQIRLEFGATETHQLLGPANRHLTTKPSELLLTAFALAWQEAKNEHVYLGMEGHGRSLEGVGCDLSRTVGWFTALFPVCIDLPATSDYTDLLTHVKETLRAIPNDGMGYGLGAYLAKDRLPHISVPVSFNYLGVFALSEDGMFQPALEETGHSTATHLSEDFSLNFVGSVEADRLRVVIEYFDGNYSASEIQIIAERFQFHLKALLAHCHACAPRLTASDTLVPALGQDAYCRLLERYDIDVDSVEALWPATPMQAGLLYHELRASGAGHYVDQIHQRVVGSCDPEIFVSAWREVVRRHSVLRSHFLLHGYREPLQVIIREKAADIRILDWSEETPERQSALRNKQIIEDRREGFNLEKGTLFRITLMLFGESDPEVIITLHHSILDGWSAGLLVQDFCSIYKQLEVNPCLKIDALPEPVSPERFVRYLQRQEQGTAISYWKDYLKDAPEGCLPMGDGSFWDDTDHEPIFSSFELGTERCSGLQKLANEYGVTLNSVVQAIWGMLLQATLGVEDVVFGATVSGRDIDLPGVEHITGLLINTLPIRLRDTDRPFSDMLRRLAEETAQGRQHGHLPLADLQAAVGSGELIRHTFIFENHAGETDDPTLEGLPFELQTLEVHDPMHFEFGLLLIPLDANIRVRFVANARRYSRGALEKLERHLCAMVDAVLETPQASTREIKRVAKLSSPQPWVLAGTFTLEPMEESIRHLARGLGEPVPMAFAGFNQLFQELLNPASLMSQNKTGINVCILRIEDLFGDDTAAWQESVEGNIDTLVDALRTLGRSCPQAFFPVHVALPSASVTKNIEQKRFIHSISRRLRDRLAKENNIVVSLSEDMGCNEKLDTFLSESEIGGVPYTDAGYVAMAVHLFRIIDAKRRKPIKVIAVDADNTLWDGVVGEDGLTNLRLPDYRIAFHERLLALKRAGVLLAVVTKNNPEDVEAALTQWPEMRLRRDDWVAVKAGWGPKSLALSELARELNLGLDSFLFMDDSALEVAEIRHAHPEVTAIHLPLGEQLTPFLDRLWLLDTAEGGVDDAQRTQRYREEGDRKAFRNTASTYAAFLAGLNLQVEFQAPDEQMLNRAAQLSVRTNQFNATQWRLTVSELRAWLENRTHHLLMVRVRDRFGDYGVCGAVFIESTDRQLRIRNFLLSCRALGRGVEHEILREVFRRFDGHERDSFSVDWCKSSMNAPVSNFLQSGAARYTGNADSGSFIFTEERIRALRADGATPSEEPTSASAHPILNRPAPSLFYQKLCTEYAELGCFLEDARKNRAKSIPSERGEFVPPKNFAEQAVASVFEELLACGQVGRLDNFFDLGGHSLKAVMAIARLQSEYSLTIGLDAFLENPIVRHIASRLSHFGDSEVFGIEPLPAAVSYTLSRAQKRLWMLCQLRDESGLAYHMPIALRFEGHLDVEGLRTAFALLAEKHESLRSVVVEEEGEPRLKVLSSLESLPWNYASEAIDEAQFIETARTRMRVPFDLEKGPLFRVHLQRLHGNCFGLVFVVHHIICDGWSIGLIVQELEEAYRQLQKGETIEVSIPLIQAKEFAAWQDSYLRNAEADASFWTHRFKQLPEPLNLALDAPRPQVKSSIGGVTTETLPSDLWISLQALARKHSVSPFMVLLAGLQAWLYRYTGSEDVCIGTPVAGRPNQSMESVVGFFVNLLPLRVQIDPQSSLEDWMMHSAEATREALAHQHYPFDLLVETLSPERDTSRAPLFDVLFAYQNEPMGALNLPGVVTQPVETGFQPSQYDLAFNLFESETGLCARLEFDSQIFRMERAERMLRGWMQALRVLVDKPKTPVCEVCCLSESEECTIKGFEEGVSYGTCRTDTIPSLVSRQASAFPDRIAVADASTQLTYGDLELQTDRNAQALMRRFGTGAKRIGVVGQRSSEYIVTLLSVMKAGYTYLPLDLEYPIERLRFMCEDSEVEAIIHVGEPISSPPQLSVPWVLLRELYSNYKYDAASETTLTAKTDAYCIYTSGSTGKPKCSLVSHEAFATMITAQIEAFGVQPGAVCGQFASMAFDASVSEIFLALVGGATLEIAPAEAREDIDVFRTWLRERKVATITLPPPFIRALGKCDLSPLKTLISAGEAAPVDLLSYHAKRIVVINAYGPSEASVCATCYRLSSSEETVLPIGRPLSPVGVRILDTRGQRVPLGVDGEICISGHTVGSGYWKRPELNQQCFTRDSLSAAPNRLYRTGDLGRWREDGQIIFSGRMDHQVKIRGFRIELGEIESVLREVKEIQEVHILPVGDQLVAFWVGDLKDTSVLRECCVARLPAYMVPARFVQVRNIPLTVNKKVDRQALLTELEAVTKRQAKRPPEGERECLVASIWESVLGVFNLSRDARFFDMGGDSIKALQVISRLRELGWTSNLKVLFAHERLMEFAGQIRPVLKTEVPGNASFYNGTFSLSPIQRWFFAEHKESPHGHFNMGIRLLLSVPIDPVRLAKAVDQLVKEHPMLRANFPRQANGLRAGWIASPDKFSDKCILNEDLPDEACTGPFDLERGPLVRFVLNGCSLRVIMHHLVVDWVSWRIILRDLENHLGQARTDADLLAGEERALVQHADYLLRWGRKHPEDRIYWQSALKGMRPHGFKIGHYGRAHLKEFSLDAEVSTVWPSVGRMAQTHLLTALAGAVFETLAISDAVFLLESHGRQDLQEDPPDLSHAVGWFTALYPVQIERKEALIELQQSVSQRLRAVPHDGIGYGVWSELAEPVLPRVQPLASLNYLGHFESVEASQYWDSMESNLEGLIADTFERDHPIDTSIWMQGGRLRVVIACAEARWVNKLADNFAVHLRNLVVGSAYEKAANQPASD